MGTSVKVEHMVFPHIHETFYLAGVQHNDIWPSETTFLEDFKKLSVNAIKGMEMKEEDVKVMVRPMSSGTAPRN